jgi:hypothetical protein
MRGQGRQASGVSVGRLVALVALAAVCSLIATLFVLRFSTDHGADRRSDDQPARTTAALRGTYAYIRENEFVLMRGDRPLARVPRVFDTGDSLHNKVVWTHGGTHVAFLSDDELLDSPEDTHLLAVDAMTGRVRRLPCPRCYDLAAVGESGVLALDLTAEGPGPGARRFALDSPAPSGTRATPPPDNGERWVLYFLASTRTHLLTSQATSYGNSGSPMQLRLVGADGGSAVSYPLFDSNNYMPAAADIDGEEQFAVAERSNPGGCAAPFPIHLLDRRGGARATDMSAALPPGFVAGVNGGVEVHDLWWGGDGHLYATIASWTCDLTKRYEDEKQVPHRPSSLWRLDGEKWVSAGGKPATMVRQLDRGTSAVLRIPDCIGPVKQFEGTNCGTGVLYQEHDGRRTTVAEGVLSVFAPPAR